MAATEWEEVLVSVLIIDFHPQHYRLNNKRFKTQGDDNLNRQIHKEDIHMDVQGVKECMLSTGTH